MIRTSSRYTNNLGSYYQTYNLVLGTSLVLGPWSLVLNIPMFELYTGRSPFITGDVFYQDAKRRSPLTNSLIAHWKPNESSGVRADSHGGNDLGDNNTTGSAAGKLGNAASFVAGNEESLSIGDNAALSMGDIDFTVAFWVWFDALTATGLAGKWSTGSFEYLAYFDGTNLRFHVSNNGFANVSVVNSQSISTATWYFYLAWHDATANTINLSVNNNTPASTAHTTGVHNGNASFYLGRNEEALTYLSGRLDSLSIWKRLLTANERTQLYNAGSGLDYPFS